MDAISLTEPAVLVEIGQCPLIMEPPFPYPFTNRVIHPVTQIVNRHRYESECEQHYEHSW